MSAANSGSKEEEFSTFRRRDLPIFAFQRRALRVVHSPDPAARGRCFELSGGPHVLGRTVGGNGEIADGLVSREHVRIREIDGTWQVEDLGGKNGTFLDGVPVKAAAPLRRGGVRSIGETLLVLDEEPDPDLLPASSTADGSAVVEVLGISYGTARLKSAIATVASGRGAVLLLGATGTGKEVAARAIHRLSGRSGAFVPVNCAAIPAEIAEAEFFGYKRGAFTGAVTDREGFFTAASGGTLFLDEVGDLPVPLQAKLLRALEDGSVQPLGGGPVQRLDLRVVAATHVDLGPAGFRRDLLARLGDWILHIPPLTERRADIPTLWSHFVRSEAGGDRPVTAELMEALLLHSWPMNVRELLKLARRLCTLVEAEHGFDLPLLPQAISRLMGDRLKRERPAPSDDRLRRDGAASPGAEGSYPSTLETPDSEPAQIDEAGVPNRAALESALQATKGNVRLAAEQNHWHRTQVYRWIRRYRLDPDRYR